ncbi:hypothetical protein JAAARDRAFT_31710 [Jaapia argillacea MUCL 33604]|uniref:Nodulin-like domain-containing protein n=1 Tax=Jaapia argillacea MUCL 33604 TaxID=933084 RepID=A0A067Q3K3_9AGAM|nr:hypothetical protein JAAARDRAFT_31710 [Jaapia argillacea MUCL 33604]
MEPREHSLLSHRLRLGATCLSIGANALCAGGIFTFPLISPALASHLKLTQPQLTTIVLAGMVGQYPFAAVVGKFIDHYGPWACSLVSSILFTSAFGLFSWEIAKTPDDTTKPSSSSFHLLTGFFFMAGLATVFSYFSSLFAASKNFPDHIGIASGTSMALFGLSPLFLSVVASCYFSEPGSGLDVTRYLTFLAILAGTVHLFGAFTLRTPKTSNLRAVSSTPVEDAAVSIVGTEVDERAPLLPGKAAPPVADIEVVPVDEDGSILDLLKDPHFWILAMITLFTLGTCEMVISNIGTIVLSLPPSYSRSTILFLNNPSTDIATSTQVRVLSLASTISRLLVGPLADFVSPVASYLPNGNRYFTRKHHVSRVAFLAGSTLLLAFTFAWTDVGVRSRENLWMLSIGTGITYGMTFTILPSIVSSIWGLTNLGRNFGVLTYAPFIGTPLFSYLYAFVSAHHARDEGVCRGIQCWQLTFWLSAGAALLAFCGSLALWRRWKGRV